jgi:hypothetical protein
MYNLKYNSNSSLRNVFVNRRKVIAQSTIHDILSLLSQRAVNTTVPTKDVCWDSDSQPGGRQQFYLGSYHVKKKLFQIKNSKRVIKLKKKILKFTSFLFLFFSININEFLKYTLFL